MAFAARDVSLNPMVMRLLASDTRVQILKHLSSRKMTVSELARVLALNKSTLHEHLGKLVSGGLINRIQSPQRQWVYYELTPHAHTIVQPEAVRPYTLPMFWASLGALVLVAAIVAVAALSPIPGPGLSQAAALSQDSILAGERTLLAVSLPPGFDSPQIRILESPEAGASVVAVPGVQSVEAGVVSFEALLAAGTYGVEVSSNGAAPVVIPLTARSVVVETSPAVLLAGIDEERGVHVFASANGEAVAGTVRLGKGAAGLVAGDAAVTTGTGGHGLLRLTPKETGAVPFVFWPAGEGNMPAAATGTLLVASPEVTIVPDRLVVGENHRFKVTVSHPLRGPVAGAEVVVTDASGNVVAGGVTDADGRFATNLRATKAGAMGVRVGALAPETIVAGAPNVVYTRVRDPYAVAAAVEPVAESSTPSFGVFVRNEGNAPATETVVLKVDGLSRASQTVALAPGEGRLVAFRYVDDAKEDHVIEIPGVSAFVHRSAPQAPLSVATPGEALALQQGGAIAVQALVVVGSLGAVFGLRSRGLLW